MNRLVYVVIDCMGAGRVVGVFTAKARADAVAATNPRYYHCHSCRLNELSDSALDWASEDIRQALQEASEI